jgi:predicted NACHT family NTPase
LQNLVRHITEKRWQEVFLLAVGMLRHADGLLLLMKQQVDELVATDEKLQEFLKWVSEKSLSFEVSYKRTAVRAFYLDIDIQLDPDRRLGCVLDFPFTRAFTCASFLARALNLEPSRAFRDIALELDFSHARYRALEPALAIALERVFAIERLLASDLAPELRRKLQQLKEQLPKRDGNEEILGDWWKSNGQAWGDQLRDVIIPHRSLGESWQFGEFSDQQKELLKHYYAANLLLVACLNSDCYVSREVRQEIEDTLLLPMAEIEKRKHG